MSPACAEPVRSLASAFVSYVTNGRVFLVVNAARLGQHGGMAHGEVGPGDDVPLEDNRAVSAAEGLHPTAARLVDQVRRSGEFTAETWREISQVMDDLSDLDLRAILEAVGTTARARPDYTPFGGAAAPDVAPLRPRAD